MKTANTTTDKKSSLFQRTRANILNLLYLTTNDRKKDLLKEIGETWPLVLSKVSYNQVQQSKQRNWYQRSKTKQIIPPGNY